jgi:S-adenosylmethionine decarboxylase
MKVTTGHHAIIDIYNVKPELANSATIWTGICKKAAIASKTTILHSYVHKFNPHGVSGIIVISESHISFHTFPEKHFVALDFYTCGEYKNFLKGLEVIYQEVEKLDKDIEVVIVDVIDRGKHRISK